MKVLDWPQYRFYSDSHPLHRWKKKLKEHGIKVQFYTDHRKAGLKEADNLLIHSRYFENGWQNISKRTRQNEDQLLQFLQEMKQCCGTLIWLDAADSTGSSDFPVIPFVDVFLKKQLHKDLTKYTCSASQNLRIWLPRSPGSEMQAQWPCPPDQLGKIKLGWNLGLNDYRYYGYKMSRLSNYLGYNLYPLKFNPVAAERRLDLTFRGTVHKKNTAISAQRNAVLTLLDNVDLEVASGSPVAKRVYLKELRNSKISISPFGWGEVCYRDFESFISGTLLIKPSMEHLSTYPDVYLPNQTYIPLSWTMDDLKQKLDYVVSSYPRLKSVAEQGQEHYRRVVNDGEAFVAKIKSIIG